MDSSRYQAEERQRQYFKKFLNPFMVAIFRLGMGRWFTLFPSFSGNVLVLRHTGRKTGIKRYQPLNYAIVGGDTYCLAGFGARSDWYRNVMANPSVEVWMPDGWWQAVVEDAESAPDRTQRVRQVMVGSGFAARLAGLNPAKMSDEEIDAASQDYRLLRIQRTDACTGPGGPGELEWVWQVATMVLLVALFRRRKR